MAFNFNALQGLSFPGADLVGIGASDVTLNANGSVTLKTQTQDSYEDGEFGVSAGITTKLFNVAAKDVAGVPGIPPVGPVITYQVQDASGVASGPAAGLYVLAYNPTIGYLTEVLAGFAPEPAFGPAAYAGTITTPGQLQPVYFLLTTGVSADHFDPVSGNSVTSVLSTLLPATFAPTVPQASSSVPLPGMGFTLGCLVFAVVVARTVFGRGSSISIA